jgi:ATP-binding cassette subfamily B protein
MPAVVVVALGDVVGDVPGAVVHGMGSPAGRTLIVALVLAAVAYGVSLVIEPVRRRRPLAL